MKYFYLIPLFTSFLSCPGWAHNKTSSSSPIEDYDKKLSEGVDPTYRRELTDQELLEKFFKKSAAGAEPQKKAKVYFPIFYETMSQPLTQIEVSFDSTINGIENLKVDAAAIIAVLDELVDPKWMPRIKELKEECRKVLEEKQERINRARSRGEIDQAAEDQTCWGILTNVSDDNVHLKFDEKKLEIRIFVKPEMRSVKIASLTNALQVEDDPTHKPDWFSALLNMNLSQSVQSDNQLYKNGREPLLGKYDGMLNFGGVVIEGEARSTEKRSEVQITEPAFVREATRMVVDFPSYGIRSQLGDLVYPVGAFQTYRQMSGLSFYTKSSLKASRLTLPGANYDLNLARRSRVAVYINEQLVQVIDLPAGRHNLRDFPLTAGKSDIKLEITDDQGRTEIQTYTVLLTNELLREGEHEVSYSFGAPSSEVQGVRQYDYTNRTASLFHRFGYSQGLTLGASYQSDSRQSIGALEVLFSTPIGYFSLVPSLSKTLDQPDGNAFKLRYVFDNVYNKERANKTTALEILTTSPDFATLGSLDPVNPTSTKLSLSHARSVSSKISLNLSASYEMNRKTVSSKEDSYSIAVGSGQRWLKDLNTNIGFRHTHTMSGTDEIFVNFFLIWSFPSEKQFVTASSSGTDSTRLDWTNYSVGGVGAHRTRLNYQERLKGPSYGGDVEYSGNRFVFNGAHQILLEESAEENSTGQKKSIHNSNLQFGTALVFAGGEFAISRPVFDSFVIFNPLKSLKNNNALVNLQRDGSFVAQTDWLGPAVVSELPSHYLSALKIDTQESAQGVSLPADHFIVKPTYRSGYSIYIGTNATIYLKSKLVGEDGTPISMIAAQAIYLDDEDVDAVTIFTNRAGLVRSEGFRPGRYRLNVPGDDYNPIEFTIPDSAEDEYDLGELKMTRRLK